MKFKALIRVVKSSGDGFGNVEVIREPLIEAEDKAGVKSILLSMYPQFFQNGKVYEKETKDKAQFFYVVIFPLYAFEIEMIEEGQWSCSYCGQTHDNKYIHRPRINERLFGENVMFCRDEHDTCINRYKARHFSNIEFPDDTNYITTDSLNYIYKCTEKSTGKCYIGKTRNAPFFRWWSHLKHSQSPFGIYLRGTKLSDWTFEVLDILPSDTPDPEVFRIESMYIKQFDSIANGYNSLISNKTTILLKTL